MASGGRAEARNPSGAGGGTPVLLLHGLGVDHRMWALQVPGLQADRPVWAPDLPGFGAEPPLPAAERTPEGYAAWVAEWLGERAAGPVHVAGYSMGGSLALLLALRAPEGVASLALCCSSPCWGRGARRAVAHLFVALGLLSMEIFQRSVVWGASRHAADPGLRDEVADMVGRSHRPTMLALYRGLADLDLRPALGRIAAPTLAIAGSRDWLAPLTHARIAARGIPGARVRTIRGGSHLACLSHPEAFTALLADFFGP